MPARRGSRSSAVLAGGATWVVAALPVAAIGALVASVRRARFDLGRVVRPSESAANSPSSP